MSTFNLPDLGEGLQQAEVVTWHVAEGEHVVVDQPLVSVETEKAVVEIPSPLAGHISRLLARPGERVKVGAPLLDFEEGPHAQAGTVVGELTPPATQTSPPPGAATATMSDALHASPVVRARARQLGVDLSRIAGKGPEGAITRADVEAAATGSTAANAGLHGARRTMALNMARAWREVAHATLHDEADIDAWHPAEDVTCRLVRAIAAGCKAEPSLNASFDAESTTLRHNVSVDLAIAIDSPDGLFAPVLRDVAAAPATDLRTRIEAMKQAVRQRHLAPGDLRGATITLSNFGTIAGRHGALIVVPPQVAIVGAGRIGDQPTRTTDGFVFHRMLPLSLSFDHRAVSGGEAARFLQAVITDLKTAD